MNRHLSSRGGEALAMNVLNLSALAGTPWLPLVVFAAELLVVTLATVRTIFLARGLKTRAALLGFFEVSLWLLAVRQLMTSEPDFGTFLAFAGGFAIGNYLGVRIEQRLALGTVAVRAVTTRDARYLVRGLRAAGFGVTCIDAHGATGPVTVILTIARRKQLQAVVAVIKGFDPTAFYSVEDVRSAAAGVFPAVRRAGVLPTPLRLFRQAA
jgi:uncharacterized protein YebE (UPF0316 family)